jgi:AcrR family transcriptional regulator
MALSTGRPPATRHYGGISASDRRAQRRRRLLAAGRRMWGESNLNEVTVRGVCAEAGLTPRYFYEQFADRDELVLAVADQVRDELFAVLLESGLNAPGDAEAKVRTGLKAFLQMIADDQHVHRIFTDILSSGGDLAERRRQALDTVTALILEHGPGLLDFAPPSPVEMRRGAMFIVGGVNQLIDAWVQDPRESAAELADACTELCLAVVRRSAR